jgi:hypothetical protein
MSQVAVPRGEYERAGFVGQMPVGLTPADADPRTGLVTRLPTRLTTVQAPGTPGGNDDADTVTYLRPFGSVPIHGHIDSRPAGSTQQPSDGMLDKVDLGKGLGDSWSLQGNDPEALGTVSHGQIGWHVLDNGQLKFLYPPGSMTPFQIQEMQKNLNREQQKFLRPK